MESRSSGPSRVSKAPQASKGISLGGGRLGPSGQEPMGFQEGNRRYPFPACPWEDRDPVPCPPHWGQGRCPEGLQQLCARAVQQGTFGGWSLGPVSIGQGSSRWARSGRAGNLLEARQLCLYLCQSAHCVLWPPVSMQSLGQVPAWPAQSLGAHVWVT